jgi:dihydroneopterin aldolase
MPTDITNTATANTTAATTTAATTTASIEIRDLLLDTRIGFFAPGERAPDKHVLDLTLWINADLVLIERDGMTHVFDYDPLLVDISRLAKEEHYETQERLITRLVQACAGYQQIESLEIVLRKAPVWFGSGSGSGSGSSSDSGSLGVRLRMDAQALHQYRLR